MPIKTYKPGSRRPAVGLTIFGPGGSGKTTIAGTMPGRGLLIDIPQVEGGDYVISDQGDHVTVTAVTMWDEIDPIYWALAKKDTKELPDADKFEWVAIDTITAMQELAKRKVISERDLQAPPHKITQPEFGMIGELVGEMVYRFRTLPIPTLWLGQQRLHGRDEDPQPKKVGVDILPSALAKLMPSMALVGYLEVGTGDDGRIRRTLRVGPPGGDYIIKARLLPGKRLPNLILKPNLTEILDYMFGNGPRPKRARDEDAIFV